MEWVIAFIVTSVIGTALALFIAIKTGRTDNSRPMGNYPRWLDEQKRRRASLNGKSNYDKP
jgi:hypothetical protein